MKYNLIMNDNCSIEVCKNIIAKVMGKTKIVYDTLPIKKWSSNILSDANNGNKVFIIDYDSFGNKSLNILESIRAKNDWVSIIIVLISDESLKDVIDEKMLLVFAKILKDQNLENELTKAIKKAKKRLTSNKVLKYSMNGETYVIPHSDILYIGKEKGTNNSIIRVKNNKYPIRKSIIEIEEMFFASPNFYKTHCSYIVNTDNIKYIDSNNEMIYFESCSDKLISRSRKKHNKNI